MVKTDWVPKVLQRFADLRWMLCIYLLVLLTFVLLAGCGPAPTPTAAPTSTKALTPTAVPPTLQKNQVGDSVIWTTSDKRVAVAVPSQAPPVVELTFESLQITPPPIGYKIDGFTFKESVLNIQARDKEKQPMLQFTSSIRLYVTYKSEDLPDPTRLTFGCRSDKQVMMFTPTTQRFTLLKAETSADGKSQFQFYSCSQM